MGLSFSRIKDFRVQGDAAEAFVRSSDCSRTMAPGGVGMGPRPEWLPVEG
jgi:hypothetical protein